MLVETLGAEPVVVAHGRQVKNFVPLPVFLRRNPNLAAIQTAITETVTTGSALASITPTTKRVIRTEPVQMSDGRIHAVHVWCGRTEDEPPERPIPGPVKWDLTRRVASDSVEALANAGMDPEAEATHGRAFIEDFPARDFNSDEAKVLALTIDAAPGRTYCTTWEFTDKQGAYRRVGFVARTAMETVEDGGEHLICRAMNLVAEVLDAPPPAADNLAQRILEGMAIPGTYRSIVDLNDWTPLKWLDEPCPYFNWRGKVEMHPEDYEHFSARMREELQDGATAAVLRLPGEDGEWVPLHVTITKVELERDIFGGLVALRLPTEDELDEVGLGAAGETAGETAGRT